MFLTLFLWLACPQMPELNAVPPEAKWDGASRWREYPWRSLRVWRSNGFKWCDDPHCPVCSTNVYGWRDVPIRKEKP